MNLEFITKHWDAVGALGQWAAAAGTFTAAFVALRLASRTNKPDIRVRVTSALVPGEWVPRVVFSAANWGTRPARMVSAGIRLPDGENLAPIAIPTEPPLPVTLESGNRMSWQMPLQELAYKLARAGFTREETFQPYYRDSLENEYATDWRFDPSKRVAGGTGAAADPNDTTDWD
jgi:hypothetical protein